MRRHFPTAVRLCSFAHISRSICTTSGFEVEGMTFRELSDKLYSEMAEYSVLTKYLGRDEIEEININGWDDIAVTYTDGHIEKAKEHF